MNLNFRGAAFAAAPFLFGSVAHAQWSSAFTSPRNAVVDANGVRLVQVEASAGMLRVEGRAGLRQVQIRGTARSSSQNGLSEIKLIAERRGDVVFIKAELPDGDWRDRNDIHMAALDLVIEVPQGVNADIADGSGDAEISDVGALEMTDGSGSVNIDNISGDVRVSDGSGDINVRNVAGSFTVRRDGSGSISATDVRGSVLVENDGSGGIDAVKIGRDFTVESKGSGSIRYREVVGKVDIPERHRDRDRDYYR